MAYASMHLGQVTTNSSPSRAVLAAGSGSRAKPHRLPKHPVEGTERSGNRARGYRPVAPTREGTRAAPGKEQLLPSSARGGNSTQRSPHLACPASPAARTLLNGLSWLLRTAAGASDFCTEISCCGRGPCSAVVTVCTGQLPAGLQLLVTPGCGAESSCDAGRARLVGRSGHLHSATSGSCSCSCRVPSPAGLAWGEGSRRCKLNSAVK